MSFARPIRIPSKLISLSDTQKDALAAAMRDASQEARPSETLRCKSLQPTTENRPVASEEILFIL